MIPINKKVVLAGFYSKGEDKTQKIIDIDGYSHILQLFPYYTKKEWSEYANSPIGKEKKFPLEDEKRLIVKDITTFYKTLQEQTYEEICIHNECPLCELKSTIAYIFKQNNVLFIYSELLTHMISAHNISINNEFVCGLMMKLNPWTSVYTFIEPPRVCNTKFEFDSYPYTTYYDYINKPINASLISMKGANILIDKFGVKITPKHWSADTGKGSHFDYLIAPLYPQPELATGSNTPASIKNDAGLYAQIEQAPATPENLQIVNYCPKCIGVLMRKYGIDWDVERPEHSPTMWNGKNFTKISKEDPDKLCGQI